MEVQYPANIKEQEQEKKRNALRSSRDDSPLSVVTTKARRRRISEAFRMAKRSCTHTHTHTHMRQFRRSFSDHNIIVFKVAETLLKKG